MAIREINLVPHETPYKSDSLVTKLNKIAKDSIKKTIHDIDKLDIFNFSGRAHLFGGSTGKRELMFLNCSPSNTLAHATRTQTTMFGIEAIEMKLLTPSDDVVFTQLLSPEGEVFAQYSAEKNSLYVLADVQSLEEAQALAMYKAMFEFFKAEVYDKKGMENSWKYTSNKDGLIRKFQKRVEESAERIIREDKQRAQRNEERMHEMQREMKTLHDNLILLRKNIDTAERNTEDSKSKVIKELDNIASHPRVSDLRIENGLLKVSIPDVYAIDKKDRRFYIGNFTVDINLDNSDVRFHGDNPRKSHWTQKDPHPHVNGSSGKACLGSVSSTIAELCAYNELYALVMTVIDFLENANIEDVAGRNVENWQQVDKDGKPIGGVVETPAEAYADDEDTWVCDYSGAIMHVDEEAFTVYTEYDGSGEFSHEQTWNYDSVQRHAIYNQHVDEYLTIDVSESVDNWYE